MAEGGIITQPTNGISRRSRKGSNYSIRQSRNGGFGETTVNFYQYGNIETQMDYELLKQDLTNEITNAVRGN